ncbi:biogenesis of lysosome-related organelles complex 1 subunit 6 isoform X2 [Agrilus planipennis]|nr:biogenesis of lysosome-related organelles complex 1 subunit 6 isoform X2 [Agrilus planipennis]
MEVATEAVEGDSEKNQHAEENNNAYTTSTIHFLSKGLLERYEPGLTKTKCELEELTTKQAVLIEQIHNENLKLSWSLTSEELISMFNLIRDYHRKLIDIKRNMRLLHERSSKLKRRALRLQQHKEKEIYLKNQQIQHEQSLIAGSSSNS